MFPQLHHLALTAMKGAQNIMPWGNVPMILFDFFVPSHVKLVAKKEIWWWRLPNVRIKWVKFVFCFNPNAPSILFFSMVAKRLAAFAKRRRKNVRMFWRMSARRSDVRECAPWQTFGIDVQPLVASVTVEYQPLLVNSDLAK